MTTPDIRYSIRYSIVVPIYNEEAVLPLLLRRLDALMGFGRPAASAGEAGAENDALARTA